MPSTNWCFKLSAEIVDKHLKVFLHRGRGIFDQTSGKIEATVLSGFRYKIKITNSEHRVHSRKELISNVLDAFFIDAGENTSSGGG